MKHGMLCYKPRSLFIEFSCFLNLKHQVPTIYIFHHKEQSILKTNDNDNWHIYQEASIIIINMSWDY